MTTPVRILRVGEVSRRIRAELAERWPGVRFTVRSGRAQWRNWTVIAWTDGPPDAAVRAVVCRYEATRGTDARGPVVFGIHGVLSTREVSPAGYALAADALERGYPIIVPRRGDGIDWPAADAIHLEPPIELHGPTFGPCEGTYASTHRSPLPVAQAIRAVAEAADMTTVQFEPTRSRA